MLAAAACSACGFYATAHGVHAMVPRMIEPVQCSAAIMLADPTSVSHIARAQPKVDGRRLTSPARGKGRGPGRSSDNQSTSGGGGGGRNRRRSSNKRSSASDALSSFVRTIEPKRLLEHAEEIQLAGAIQRLKDLEDLYTELSHRDASDGTSISVFQQQCARRFRKPPTHFHCVPLLSQSHTTSCDQLPTSVVRAAHCRSAVEAILAEGGFSREEWAAAANLTVPELRTQLREGKLARETIVERNVGLVGNLVQQLKRSSGGRLDSGITEADLVQEGCISLLRAAERFDVSMGVRFGTYATFWAKAAIKRALHEQTRVVRLPSRVQNTYGKIKRATDLLSAQEGVDVTDVTDDDVSTELMASGVKLSPQRVRQTIEHVRKRPSSLDASLGGDGKSTVLDLVVDHNTDIEAGVIQSMLQSDLRKVMQRHLRAEEISVLSLRFGLEDGTSRTIRQVGEELDISYSTTKHLLFTGLNKLRKPHVALALRDYASKS